jgi:DNA-binding NtrC family response regulator
MTEPDRVVFVVDDDASLRESLKDLIRSVGLRVETFASAQEFLRSKRPDAPGCLVLDVRLRSLSGLDLQKRPGNIRELQNLIERAVILTPGSVLRIQTNELQSSGPIASTVGGTLEDVERQRILQTLRETGGVIGGQQGAAARLGLKRTTLLSKMQRLGISRFTKYSSFAGPGILTAMVSFFSAVV